MLLEKEMALGPWGLAARLRALPDSRMRNDRMPLGNPAAQALGARERA